MIAAQASTTSPATGTTDQPGAASQDSGRAGTGNGTPIWTQVTGGDGGYTAINPVDPTVVWSSTQWVTGSYSSSIYRTKYTATTRTTAFRGNGLNLSDRAAFIPPLIMDPNTPTTLYIGSNRVYRTIDEGVTWTAISSQLTIAATAAILTIAVAPSNSQIIYVGTSDGRVVVSRDAGVTFVPTTTPFVNRAVSRLVIDRGDPNRVLATVSTLGGPHVYRTADGGATWTNITGNLPDVPVLSATLIPDSPNLLFIGTDLGVFQTSDGGTTWQTGPVGMPLVRVNDLVYDVRTQTLYAATYGRGIFGYALANPVAVLRGDVNKDGRVDAFDALLLQQALVGSTLPSGMTALPSGDANCNGTLEAVDALIVLRAAVGLPTSGSCAGAIR